MKRDLFQSVLLAISLLALAGCNNHFISDSSLREQIHNEWAERKELFANGDCFAGFDEQRSMQEREAMEFLFSSMPSADLADYAGD